MKYINLPGTDFNISCIVFGTWGLAGPPFWDKVPEKDAISLLHKARAEGINFFDTAPVYGMGAGEELLAKAFGKNPDIIIATKVGLRWRTPDRRTIYHDLSPDSIRWEIEQTLKRLNQDSVDLYQVHWPDPKTPIAETFTVLDKLKKEGKIRFIGVSNYTVEQIIESQKYTKISTVQPRFNYLDQKALSSLLPFCLKNEIGTLIYSPLASGLLTGKYDIHAKFNDWRSGDFADQFSTEKREKATATIESLKSKAEKLNVSLTQLMLEWTLNQKGVSTILAGLRKETHLHDPISAGKQLLKNEELEF